MDYTPAKVRNASTDFSNMLCIPHQLPGFVNTSTELVGVGGGREAYVFHGDIIYDQPWCEACGSKMEAHQHLHTRLRHLPFGPYISSKTAIRPSSPRRHGSWCSWKWSDAGAWGASFQRKGRLPPGWCAGIAERFSVLKYGTALICTKQ